MNPCFIYNLFETHTLWLVEHVWIYLRENKLLDKVGQKEDIIWIYMNSWLRWSYSRFHSRGQKL